MASPDSGRSLVRQHPLVGSAGDRCMPEWNVTGEGFLEFLFGSASCEPTDGASSPEKPSHSDCLQLFAVTSEARAYE